jgi:Na+-transporting methylmalonyl-CoA/oxaloacetate decarboxylase gamma subunit
MMGYELHPDFAFALDVTITGLVVVFTALVSVSILVWLFEKVDRPQPASEAKQPVQEPRAQHQPPTATQKTMPGEAIAPETLAAIMAAATMATQQKIRIVRVQYRSAPGETAWSRQGRYSIMTSHLPKR